MSKVTAMTQLIDSLKNGIETINDTSVNSVAWRTGYRDALYNIINSIEMNFMTIELNNPHMTPLQQSHLDIIQSEVIPMTDESNAKEHADISVRFAWDILKILSIGMIASSDHLIICTEMDRLEKML